MLPFPAGCDADEDLQEFVVTSGGAAAVFNRGNSASIPNLHDRVVFHYKNATIVDGNHQATFCGVMAHVEGTSPGQFELCTSE